MKLSKLRKETVLQSNNFLNHNIYIHYDRRRNNTSYNRRSTQALTSSQSCSTKNNRFPFHPHQLINGWPMERWEVDRSVNRNFLAFRDALWPDVWGLRLDRDRMVGSTRESVAASFPGATLEGQQPANHTSCKLLAHPSRTLEHLQNWLATKMHSGKSEIR